MDIAEIAALALDAVSGAITDAVHPATLTRTARGAYDPSTGAHATTATNQTGRAIVDTVRPVADVFPDFVVGPSDQLIMLEGFTSARENDMLAFAGRTGKVVRTQDIAAAGSLFYVVARVSPTA